MIVFAAVALIAFVITWWRPIAGIALALFADSVVSSVLGSFLQMDIEAQTDSHLTLLVSFPVLFVLCLKAVRLHILGRGAPPIPPFNAVDMGLLGLGLTTILGCQYTPNLWHGIEVAARFWVFGLSYYFFARFSVACPATFDDCLDTFLTWVWTAALITSVVCLLESDPGSLFRMTLRNVNPISFSMLMGNGLLVALYRSLDESPSNRWWKMAQFSAIPVFLYCAVAANERGPLISLMCSSFFLIAAFALMGKRVGPFLAVCVALGLIGTAVALSGQYFPEAFENLAERLDTRESSIWVHLALFHQAIDLFSESPLLGAGTACMEITNGRGLYAHNLILELASENGMAGIMMVVFFISGVVYLIIRSIKSGNPGGCFFAAFTIYAFAVTQTAGHYSDWKSLYFGAGMLTLCVARGSSVGVERCSTTNSNRLLSKVFARRSRGAP